MIRFITTAQLAEMTGLSVRALEDDRATGQLGGIPFVKFGRAVRYRIDDVERWSESRRYIGGVQGHDLAPAVPTRFRKGGR